jgi:uncharacterized membrane protein YphA (DoxX/SURF4 family)
MSGRQRAAWTILRIAIGTFFLFEGLGKLRWFTDASMLRSQLAGWAQAAVPGTISAWYVQRLALPYAVVFARLVPLGEMLSGLALILGVWTPVFAFVAFFMALNFQVASGAVFRYTFLTSGYGLPVLGSTLALALAMPMGGRTMRMKGSRPVKARP